MKDTRERLVDAAERLLRKRGLSHLSTREVARTAGVADGAMYHHFADKNELLLAVLGRPAPQYLEAIRNLPLAVGQDSVEATLRELAWNVYLFHRHALPITASLFADIELLERHRQMLRANKVGPAATFESIRIYLAAEQRIGRLSATLDLEAASSLLVAGPFQIAFVETHWGEKLTQAEARRRVDAVVHTLLTGMLESAG
ncbi:MAG: TetR/AcrR family transcriptional regulator [Deltaproteobacteria bacterium]|nr:TetR/AcrR family transcriptional regulator [Nannocystaceae bacterium]